MVPPPRAESAGTGTGTGRKVSLSSSTSSLPGDSLESAYTAASQAFVRRDHPKAQAALRTLHQEVAQVPRKRGTWWDPGKEEGEVWRIKYLKLYVSSWVSYYLDHPSRGKGINDLELNVDGPPSALLQDLLTHTQVVLSIDNQAGIDDRDDMSAIPPTLISTFLLASLKLPPPTSLAFAHDLVERWLTALPDEFIYSISASQGRVKGKSDAAGKQKMERLRADYLKVIEVFVGEVLVREGEWEMARHILDGEVVMSSKRKESLYRHIRASQNRPKSNPSSPSTSILLPSPSSSGVLPQKSRSRSSSTSSSSSELTARPNAQRPASTLSTRVTTPSKDKGKGKGKALPAPAVDVLSMEKEDDSISTRSTSTFAVPSKLYINHPNPGQSPLARSSTPPSNTSSRSLFDLLPPSLRTRLKSKFTPRWAAAVLPIPLGVLLLLAILVRRLRRRGRVESGAAVFAGVAGRRWREWALLWLRWWLAKMYGVWVMGTTITYL